MSSGDQPSSDSVSRIIDVDALAEMLSPSSTVFLNTIIEFLQNKPKNKEDALKLYHLITTQLGTVIVSDLPPLEQKAVLVGLWAMEQLEASTVGCFGKK